MVTNSNMPHFVAQDGVQNLYCTRGSWCGYFAKLGLDKGRCIQPSGLQGARNQGHAGQHIFRRSLAHLPQAIMCIKVAIGIAQAF